MLSFRDYLDVLKYPVVLGSVFGPVGFLSGQTSAVYGILFFTLLFVLPFYVGRMIAVRKNGGLFDAALAGGIYGLIVNFVYSVSGFVLSPAVEMNGVAGAFIGVFVLFWIFLVIDVFCSMSGSFILVKKGAK